MSKNPVRICMLADRHNLFDDRVYWKEALSLVRNGYHVILIMAADSEERGITAEGVHFIKIRKKDFFRNRFLNFIANLSSREGLYPRMLREAVKQNADVYHIHDLNVIRIAGKLKRMPGCPKLINDVHEPYPENILDYNQTKGSATLLKYLYSAYIRRFEKKSARKFDLIVTTEENLRQRFLSYHHTQRVEIIYNYTDLSPVSKPDEHRQVIYDAIYCGGITENRGALKILEAVKIAVREKPELIVLFLGTFFPPELKQRMNDTAREYRIEQNIILRDQVPYHEVARYYEQSRIGLGIFLPIRTHHIILQIKIFEYFAFGLPIIGSNFGHIKNYIEKHNAGICVNPEDPGEIASALIRLSADKELYHRMSQNAAGASVHYSWNLMEKKLLSIYERLISAGSNDRDD